MSGRYRLSVWRHRYPCGLHPRSTTRAQRFPLLLVVRNGNVHSVGDRIPSLDAQDHALGDPPAIPGAEHDAYPLCLPALESYARCFGAPLGLCPAPSRGSWMVIAGYVCFIWFFRLEGRRFFAAHTEIKLASDI